MVSAGCDLEAFEAKVFAAARPLLRQGERVVVGTSGGADSAALAAALARLAPRLGIDPLLAHVDHQMRPSSADDAAVARQLAEALALPFWLLAVEAGGDRGSEASAREARYAALTALARELSAAAVAVGHTRTDQAETVLLRLLRGSAARGLAAMAASRPLAACSRGGTSLPHGAGALRLVRPLLAFPREEVRAYAAALELPTHEDPTNHDPRFRRNALRRLWPALLELSPRLELRLAQVASLARDDERALDDLAAAALESLREPGGELSAAAVRALPPAVARRLLRRLAAEVEPTATPSTPQLERTLALVSRREPGRAHLAGDLEAGVARGRLRLARRLREAPPAPFCHAVGGDGRWPCPEADLALVVSRAPVEGGNDPDLLWLSPEEVRFPLLLRSRRPGDRFHPQGAPGGRKLKRFLIDHGVARSRRDRLPLLCQGDEILWVVGLRPSERARRPPVGSPALRLWVERVAG